MLANRMSGFYAPVYWATLLLNAALPQLLWSRRLRRDERVLLTVGIGVVIGMWLERFMLVVTSLYQRLPARRLGPFLSHRLGLGASVRLDRSLRLSVSAFRPPAARVVHVRDPQAPVAGGERMTSETRLYGLMGRFPTPSQLVEAARRCRRDYHGVEAYSPFPVRGMAEALALGPDRLARWALLGGLFGAGSGFLIQVYSAVIAYPIDVGGRPAFSWPAFLPITILLALFWGSVGATLGLLILDRLPRLHHPLFNVPEFSEASRGGLFLVIRADDPAFDEIRAREQLLSLGATSVEAVVP